VARSQRLKERSSRLGRQIRDLRRARGLTQEKLGERAGLSYKFIGEIERGTGNPTVATLLAISEALGIDVIHLFEPRSNEPGGTRLYPLTPAEFDRVQEALDSLGTILKKPGRKKPRAGRR
jgi:transcriptional regulator with XRE-family HTH domain